jgi:probable rRNA maturation factor
VTVRVDVSVERGLRLPLARRRACELAKRALTAEGAREAVVSLSFCSDASMASINRRYLGHRGATDVIAFSLPSPSTVAPLAGDVYIGAERARVNASALGVPWRQELARLVVHGVLHVMGHDHPAGVSRERSAMWRRQERLLSRLLIEGPSR